MMSKVSSFLSSCSFKAHRQQRKLNCVKQVQGKKRFIDEGILSSLYASICILHLH